MKSYDPRIHPRVNNIPHHSGNLIPANFSSSLALFLFCMLCMAAENCMQLKCCLRCFKVVYSFQLNTLAGSFSRTAVNFSAGCQTAVSNIVMAITVLVSLQLFTRLLYYTPVAILASIILSALPGLIDISEACYIWKVDKLDFLACVGAFLGVLFASVEIGLLVAVSCWTLSTFCIYT